MHRSSSSSSNSNSGRLLTFFSPVQRRTAWSSCWAQVLCSLLSVFVCDSRKRASVGSKRLPILKQQQQQQQHLTSYSSSSSKISCPQQQHQRQQQQKRPLLAFFVVFYFYPVLTCHPVSGKKVFALTLIANARKR